MTWTSVNKAQIGIEISAMDMPPGNLENEVMARLNARDAELRVRTDRVRSRVGQGWQGLASSRALSPATSAGKSSVLCGPRLP